MRERRKPFAFKRREFSLENIDQASVQLLHPTPRQVSFGIRSCLAQSVGSSPHIMRHRAQEIEGKKIVNMILSVNTVTFLFKPESCLVVQISEHLERPGRHTAIFCTVFFEGIHGLHKLEVRQLK